MMSQSVAMLLAAAARTVGGSEARLEVETLLAHVLRQSRAWLYAHAEETPGLAAIGRFHELVAERRAGKPLAYITGQREFWSLPLEVTCATLIPRADTEVLVEQALLQIKQNALVNIADLGTGSGAVAIAIASERPRAGVLATDISESALQVARANALRLKLTNIEFKQGDWCEALRPDYYDVIVSNPPYLAERDVHLAGDLRFEPRAALVSGADGMAAIRTIVASAVDRLKKGGWLLVEHGCEQGAAVRELFIAQGFGEVYTANDLERRERVTGGHRAR